MRAPRWVFVLPCFPLEVIACVPRGSLIGRHHSKPIRGFFKIFDQVVIFMTEQRLRRNKRTHRPMRERGGTLASSGKQGNTNTHSGALICYSTQRTFRDTRDRLAWEDARLTFKWDKR